MLTPPNPTDDRDPLAGWLACVDRNELEEEGVVPILCCCCCYQVSCRRWVQIAKTEETTMSLETLLVVLNPEKFHVAIHWLLPLAVYFYIINYITKKISDHEKKTIRRQRHLNWSRIRDQELAKQFLTQDVEIYNRKRDLKQFRRDLRKQLGLASEDDDEDRRDDKYCFEEQESHEQEEEHDDQYCFYGQESDEQYDEYEEEDDDKQGFVEQESDEQYEEYEEIGHDDEGWDLLPEAKDIEWEKTEQQLGECVSDP